jgi:hypothetical protein
MSFGSGGMQIGGMLRICPWGSFICLSNLCYLAHLEGQSTAVPKCRGYGRRSTNRSSSCSSWGWSSWPSTSFCTSATTCPRLVIQFLSRLLCRLPTHLLSSCLPTHLLNPLPARLLSSHLLSSCLPAPLLSPRLLSSSPRLLSSSINKPRIFLPRC